MTRNKYDKSFAERKEQSLVDRYVARNSRDEPTTNSMKRLRCSILGSKPDTQATIRYVREITGFAEYPTADSEDISLYVTLDSISSLHALYEHTLLYTPEEKERAVGKHYYKKKAASVAKQWQVLNGFRTGSTLIIQNYTAGEAYVFTCTSKSAVRYIERRPLQVNNLRKAKRRIDI